MINMSFRFDAQHLRPDQQAIIRKRDENNELLKKSKEKTEEKEEIKLSTDGKCPYCSGENLESLGTGHGVGSNLEAIKIKIRYKCLKCKKDFYKYDE